MLYHTAYIYIYIYIYVYILFYRLLYDLYTQYNTQHTILFCFCFVNFRKYNNKVFNLDKSALDQY